MAFTEDLGEFFDTSQGFAVAATWNGSTTIEGIFDNEYFEDPTGRGAGGESSQPSFICIEDDVEGAAHGDTLEVEAVVYTVVGVQPDGAGLVKLVLQKP